MDCHSERADPQGLAAFVIGMREWPSDIMLAHREAQAKREFQKTITKEVPT